jgi:hypothetical protein
LYFYIFPYHYHSSYSANSLTLDNGRNQKVEQVHTILCHFPQHHPQTGRLFVAHYPTCDRLHIMWILYPLFFSHQQASLISYTNEWATFRLCRAFHEFMISVRTASPYPNQNHKNRWHLRSKHPTWFSKTKARLGTTRIVYTKTSTRPALRTNVTEAPLIIRNSNKVKFHCLTEQSTLTPVDGIGLILK